MQSDEVTDRDALNINVTSVQSALLRAADETITLPRKEGRSWANSEAFQGLPDKRQQQKDNTVEPTQGLECPGKIAPFFIGG